MVGATAPADTTTTDEDDDMKILGLDFGDGTHGYARIIPGLGAYSMDQATADDFYCAGYKTSPARTSTPW